jgi:serine/threonine protein kinase
VADAADDLARGTMLAGRYLIEARIGSGTMGTVFEVTHALTRHRRALKLLRVDVAADREMRERFLREVSAAGRIGNPHIVEVLDAGVLDDGRGYLVTELLEGESLAALLARRTKLPIPELADIVAQACDALHAAHESGIVHRDVKPANIWIANAGGRALVKLLDFGVCKFAGDLTHAPDLTADPSSLGTPSYMSPEQVRGLADVDGRADVWALGVILYLASSGRRPFSARTLPELAVAIDRGRIEPLAEAELPDDFREVVERAMAIEREDRYPTARALAEALAPFIGTDRPIVRAPRRRRSPLVLIGIAVATIVAATLAVLLPRAERANAPFPTSAPSATSVVATAASTSAPPMSVIAQPSASLPIVVTPRPPTASDSLLRENPYR